MNVTAADVVRRALYLVGAVSAGSTPSAQEAADGLFSLNAMLHGLSAQEGIAFPHSDYDAEDTVYIGDKFIDGLIAMLAKRLASEYGATVDNEVMERARKCETGLAAEYNSVRQATFNRTLVCNGWRGRGLSRHQFNNG